MRLDFTRPLLECWTDIAKSDCRLVVLMSAAHPTLLLVHVMDRENATRDHTYARDAFEGVLRLYERARARTVAPTRIVNACPCGRDFTGAQWLDLALVGTMDGLELRNCVCGSTRAIPLKDFAASTLAQGAHDTAPDHQRVTGGSLGGRVERSTFDSSRSERAAVEGRR